MNIVYFIAQQLMFFMIPLLVVALGGMFSERSGISNIALDGTMIVGAFCGTLFINQTQDVWSGQGQLLVALLIAGISGLLFMLLHAFASITLNASQIISGISLNLIAPALAIYLARVLFGYQRIMFSNTFLIKKIPVLGDIPVIGQLLFTNTYIHIWIGFLILVISYIVTFKTKFGLRLRACGENPFAADAVGINVRKMRYCGVLISGFLAGMGGLIFVVPTTTQFSGSVASYGFLAIAVLVFGQWKPYKILTASFLFALAKTIASSYTAIPALVALGWSSYIYKMLPYLFTIIMLVLTSNNPQEPKAVGKPYISGGDQ
ncbi:MAG: ABC transporter permease [Anaerolineaceae bacterium]